MCLESGHLLSLCLDSKRKEGGDKALLRWAKRQRQLSQQKKWEGESDDEDDDMPLIKRRKIRRKPKPSKQ